MLLVSLALCLPALFVFASIAGAELTAGIFFAAVLGFAGRLALLAFAMVPVVWLFSVSTRALGLIVLMHVFMWLCALLLAHRSLRWPGERGRGVVALWLLLLLLVSLQVATASRPVLLRGADTPLVERGKLFFLEHFDDAVGKRSP